MSCAKRVWKKLFGTKPLRVLLLGLDAAGKTTILYQLMGKDESTVPTIGFNVESIKVPPLEFLVWDVSGQDRLRSFWRHYYHGTTGIVFVVDSHDVERLPIARKELHGILREEELANAVVLIIANKTDLPQAVSTEQLVHELDLHALHGRTLHVQPASAAQNKGLREGLFWLAKAMKNAAKHQAIHPAAAHYAQSTPVQSAPSDAPVPYVVTSDPAPLPASVSATESLSHQTQITDLANQPGSAAESQQSAQHS